MHIVLEYNLYSTMLDPCEHITFLSAQTYSSVCCALKLGNQAEKEIVRLHRACNHSVSRALFKGKSSNTLQTIISSHSS